MTDPGPMDNGLWGAWVIRLQSFSTLAQASSICADCATRMDHGRALPGSRPPVRVAVKAVAQCPPFQAGRSVQARESVPLDPGSNAGTGPTPAARAQGGRGVPGIPVAEARRRPVFRDRPRGQSRISGEPPLHFGSRVRGPRRRVRGACRAVMIMIAPTQNGRELAVIQTTETPKTAAGDNEDKDTWPSGRIAAAR